MNATDLARHTPMMQQYVKNRLQVYELKEEYGKCV